MLFDPFEKQLDLPTFPVEFRDRKWIQLSVIRDEPVYLICRKVFIGHHSEWFRVMLARFWSCKSDHFITNHSRLYISWFRINYLKLHIVLGDSNEERFLPINSLEQTEEVHICFIGHINGSRLYIQFIEDIYIVDRSLRQPHENREIAPQVQQGMHLDPSFVFSERSPWTQFQAQTDGTAVKGIYQIVDVEPEVVVILIQRTSDVHENTCKIGIDPPVAKFVGFGKCIPWNSMPDPTVVEFTGYCFQAVLDVPKTVSFGKLGKAHDIEVIPTGEVADTMVPIVSGDTFIKFIFRDYRHQLCENCFSAIHGENRYDFTKNADFKSLKLFTLVTYLILINYAVP
jgi:hypothetical protein